MSTLPRPTPGTASIPFADGALVYDRGAGEICVLNGTGAVVWAACCDGVDRDVLLAELAAATDRSADELAAEVDHYLDQLVGDGLVGEPQPEPVDIWLREAPEGGGPLRQRFGVLGEVVELRTGSSWFHEQAAVLCADLRTDAPATRWMVVEEDVDDDGTVRLAGPRVGWLVHDGLEALLAGLPSELNFAAVSWAGGLALHAGGVRRPDGLVVALLGESGAGKSTLVAALVRAGWDYLTDEAVGLAADLVAIGYPKPLALDEHSRGLLGLAAGELDVPVGVLRHDVEACAGPVGHLGALVLLDRRDTSDSVVEPIDPDDRLATIAGHALNLGESGAAGLHALAAASASVACWRLTYGSLDDAVARLEGLATPA